MITLTHAIMVHVLVNVIQTYLNMTKLLQIHSRVIDRASLPLEHLLIQTTSPSPSVVLMTLKQAQYKLELESRRLGGIRVAET